MDYHIKEYFSQYREDTSRGNFHKVIVLQDALHMTWETVQKLVPKFCKGWYELSHLPSKDRIEFSRDFWLAKLPYHPNAQEFITKFFDSLDDVCIFITQKKFDDPHEAYMVYSLKDDAGFFRGGLPAEEEDLEKLKRTFPEFILPEDYLAFLQIHDGFSKTTDTTGITPSKQMGIKYQEFQKMLEEQDGTLTTTRTKVVDPKTLIPFYGSFGMPFYQCFWAEWYPENEMGNVYYSSSTKTISDVEGFDPSSEHMFFPTFIDWLLFYMERVD